MHSLGGYCSLQKILAVTAGPRDRYFSGQVLTRQCKSAAGPYLPIAAARITHYNLPIITAMSTRL